MSARIALRLMLVLAAGAAVNAVQAQSVTPSVPAFTTNFSKRPPPLPDLKSPVSAFRDLLAMSLSDREQFLAHRPAPLRQRIVEKLGEYEAMKPVERERRLRATETQWYLLAILQMSVPDRTSQISTIPETVRPTVVERLQQWDQLPADEQKAILKYEKTMEQFVDQNLERTAAITNVLTHTPVAMRSNAFANLDSFLKLPPEQRQQMYASFQRFFDLSDAEKQKNLSALPDGQRSQMANKLQNLAHLSPGERAEYLKALRRFSSMSEVDRRAFIKNAEQWRQLTPAERQAWRALVIHIPSHPPLPPGVAVPPPPLVSATNRQNRAP